MTVMLAGKGAWAPNQEVQRHPKPTRQSLDYKENKRARQSGCFKKAQIQIAVTK
jgi:hypothetical protein